MGSMRMYNKAGVRITHIPTGEQIYVDLHRSQHQNRDVALSVIKSRLWAKENGYERPNPDQVIEYGPLEDYDG